VYCIARILITLKLTVQKRPKCCDVYYAVVAAAKGLVRVVLYNTVLY
jgi:hypothetical protein